MKAAYLDTTALVKLYGSEPGSEWLRGLMLGPDAPAVLISRLALVEATCALARLGTQGELSAADRAQVLLALEHDAAHRFIVLDMLTRVMQTAQGLANRHPLRTPGSIQLATAWLANREIVQAGLPPLTFLCADSALLEVARTEGLVVDDPSSHP